MIIKPFRNVTPKIHETAYIAENAVVIGDVEIGENASVWYGSVLRGDVNSISIGARTNLQDGTIVHVTTKDFPTMIEHDITVGHRVTLHGCHVESGCLIGIGSILLDGVRVGRNSLVAAGSLLTPGTVIPPGSLAMGSPAQVKRPLTDDEIKGIERNVAGYVELAGVYRSAI